MFVHGFNSRHGRTPECDIFHAMHARCRRDPNYTSRGITVCQRWSGPNGVVNFVKDMGLRPSSKHTIERLDNDKGYFPENCVWATRYVQNNNKRCVPKFEAFGKFQSVAMWAKEYSIHPETLRTRIKVQGMSLEEALLKPVTRKKRNK